MIKSRVLFVLSTLMIIASLILMFTGTVLNFQLTAASILVLLIGVLLLMYSSSKSKSFRCEECGEIFEITLLQNVFELKGGNYKSIYCPKCNKKTICKGLPKGNIYYKRG